MCNCVQSVRMCEIFATTPTLCQTTPIFHDRACYHKFLGEKMNCKSSGIDLVAIEAHLIILIIRPRVMQGLHESANSYYGHATKENNN